MDRLHMIPNVLIPANLITLTTPINGTKGLTLGLPTKDVTGVCDTLKPAILSPIFTMQLCLASILITACKFLFKPFIQASVVSQIMGGIIGGPSGLGRNPKFLAMMYPFHSLYSLNTYATFGYVLFVFIAGVKTDMSIIKHIGRKEWMLGVSAFVFPLLACIPASSFLEQYIDIDQELKDDLVHVSFLVASTTFNSIALFLEDLQLLNSELGRTALSSAMVSGALSYTALATNLVRSKLQNEEERVELGELVAAIVMVLIILFPLRYLLLWINKQTPPGKGVQESYLGLVLLLVLASAFAGETIGLNAFFGPSLMGLVLPDASILAATLVQKVDAIVTFAILPLYFLSCGLSTQLPEISPSAYYTLLFLVLLGFSAKFIGITIVSLFHCGFVPKDAFTLALTLNAIGTMDVGYYRRFFQGGLIDYRCFSVLMTSGMLLSGFVSFMVKALYDPFLRYLASERLTIQHFLNSGGEFRVLACIHNHEYVPSIINLLEASNPTKQSQLCIYLLHLVELSGGVSGAVPLQLVHPPNSNSNSNSNSHTNPSNHDLGHDKSRHRRYASLCNSTESIINAFRKFELDNDSLVTLQAYSTVSPRATMHNDVCTLAVEKRTRLVIIPFHIKWKSSSGTTTETPEFRSVNLMIMDKAPCSVGILIDRGSDSEGGLRSTSVKESSWFLYRVGVFFIGGPDDREAVSFASRMVKHPHVCVTIIRLYALLEIGDHNLHQKKLDNWIINQFRQTNVAREKAVYKEETLVDSEETCKLVRSMHNEFDLILVGRRTESPLLRGLSTQYPELGPMGDLLASKDFYGKVSILVVQQHMLPIATLLLETNSSGAKEALLLHQDSPAPLKSP